MHYVCHDLLLLYFVLQVLRVFGGLFIKYGFIQSRKTGLYSKFGHASRFDVSVVYYGVVRINKGTYMDILTFLFGMCFGAELCDEYNERFEDEFDEDAYEQFLFEQKLIRKMK